MVEQLTAEQHVAEQLMDEMVRRGNELRGPSEGLPFNEVRKKHLAQQDWMREQDGSALDLVVENVFLKIDRLSDLVDGVMVRAVSEDRQEDAARQALDWLLERDRLESIRWMLSFLKDRATFFAVRAALEQLDELAENHTTTWLLIPVPALPQEVNARFLEEQHSLDSGWWSQFAR